MSTRREGRRPVSIAQYLWSPKHLLRTNKQVIQNMRYPSIATHNKLLFHEKPANVVLYIRADRALNLQFQIENFDNVYDADVRFPRKVMFVHLPTYNRSVLSLMCSKNKIMLPGPSSFEAGVFAIQSLRYQYQRKNYEWFIASLDVVNYVVNGKFPCLDLAKLAVLGRPYVTYMPSLFPSAIYKPDPNDSFVMLAFDTGSAVVTGVCGALSLYYTHLEKIHRILEPCITTPEEQERQREQMERTLDADGLASIGIRTAAQHAPLVSASASKRSAIEEMTRKLPSLEVLQTQPATLDQLLENPLGRAALLDTLQEDVRCDPVRFGMVQRLSKSYDKGDESRPGTRGGGRGGRGRKRNTGDTSSRGTKRHAKV